MKDVVSKSGAFIVFFESVKESMDWIDPACFTYTEAAKAGEELREWEQVQQKFLGVWDEGMALLRTQKEKLKGVELPELKARQRYAAYQQNEGDEFDYDRFMAGDPPWKVMKREKADGPATVTIVIDTTASWDRDPTSIFWRGSAALALAELLTEKGYGTEIWVINGSTAFGDNKEPLVLAANLKRPEDPFDISTLTNAVAGWFYRTVTFAMIRTVGKKFNREIMPWLGSVYTPIAKDLNCLTSDEVRVYSAGHYTFNGALEHIKNEIKRIGEAEETGKLPE